MSSHHWLSVLGHTMADVVFGPDDVAKRGDDTVDGMIIRGQ
jgi:hypothetical protein